MSVTCFEMILGWKFSTWARVAGAQLKKFSGQVRLVTKNRWETGTKPHLYFLIIKFRSLKTRQQTCGHGKHNRGLSWMK